MLKEGVEYRIKISFRVRILIWKLKEWGTRLLQSQLGECLCPARGVVLEKWALPARGVGSMNGDILLSPCSSLCR